MERRQNQRETKQQATRSLLTQVKKRMNYAALQLNADEGHIVAHAPSQIDGEAIAMVAQVAGEGLHFDSGLLELITKGRGLRIWQIPSESASYFLCAVGGPDDYPTKTIDSIKRILNEAEQGKKPKALGG